MSHFLTFRRCNQTDTCAKSYRPIFRGFLDFKSNCNDSSSSNALTYQQLAIQSRAYPMSKDRGICQSMTSLALTSGDSFHSDGRTSTASFAALSPSLCGGQPPPPSQSACTVNDLSKWYLHKRVATTLRSHRSPTAAEPKCLTYRRRAGLICQTGTARATAHKEERIMAAKVPNLPTPSTRSYFSVCIEFRATTIQ